MRLAGTRRNQPRVVQRIDDLALLARLVVDLLVRTRRQERGERVHDGQQALPCHAGRGRDHVLLRDPRLVESLRVRELERADATIGGKVGVEHDDFGMTLGQLEQCFAIRGGHVFVSDTLASGDTGFRLALAQLAASIHLRKSKIRKTGANPLDELLVRTRERLVVWCAGMPAVGPATVPQRARMLHEGNALALHGVSHEHLRHVCRRAERGEGPLERIVVMAVTGRDVPAERAELRLEVAKREDVVRRLVGLQLVAIDDHPEVALSVRGCRLQALEVLAFLQLAVAGHHDDATATPKESFRPGHPSPLRNAHAERA